MAQGNNNVRATLSEADVDGVVAVGPLPFMKWIEPSYLDLSKLDADPLMGKVRSVHNIGNQWLDFKCLPVRGTGFWFVTDMSVGEFKDTFLDFFAHSLPRNVGNENQWLAFGCSTRLSVSNRMAEANKYTVRVDTDFLCEFARWVNPRLRNGPFEIRGGYFKFGMKAPFDMYWPMLQKSFEFDDLYFGNIHVAAEVRGTGDKSLVVLNRNTLKAEYGNHQVQWFHACGILDGGAAIFKSGSLLLAEQARATRLSMSRLRVYNPKPMHCRSADLRTNRAMVAARTCLGGGSMSAGPFHPLFGKADQWVNAVTSVFEDLLASGDVMRLEFVLDKLTEVNGTAISRLRNHIRTFFGRTGAQRIIVTQLTRDWYELGVSQALELVRNGRPIDLAKVAAAEAYLGLLLDGGSLRVFYSGMTAALGHSLKDEVNTGHQYAQPRTPDFTHVRPDSFPQRNLAKVIAFYLHLDIDTTTHILEEFEAMPRDPQSEGYMLCFMRIVRVLECKYQGDPNSAEMWTQQFHSNRGTLHSLVTPANLAEVLTYEPPLATLQGWNWLKAIRGRLVNAFLETAYPTDSEERRKSHLTELIRTHFKVFPQSVPVSPRHKRGRWWKVGAESEGSRARTACEDITRLLPLTLDRVPWLTAFDVHDELICEGLSLLEADLATRQGLTRRELTARRMILVIIVVIALNQQRQNNPTLHPYIHWGEFRAYCGADFYTIFDEYDAYGIVTNVQRQGVPPTQTICGCYQVVNRMREALANLRRTFEQRGVVQPLAPPPPPPPPLNVPNTQPDDRVPADDIDVPVPDPAVRRRRVHADVSIVLQENMVRTTRQRSGRR